MEKVGIIYLSICLNLKMVELYLDLEISSYCCTVFPLGDKLFFSPVNNINMLKLKDEFNSGREDKI